RNPQVIDDIVVLVGASRRSRLDLDPRDTHLGAIDQPRGPDARVGFARGRCLRHQRSTSKGRQRQSAYRQVPVHACPSHLIGAIMPEDDPYKPTLLISTKFDPLLPAGGLL